MERGKKEEIFGFLNLPAQAVKNPSSPNFPQRGVAGQTGHKPAQPRIANCEIETAM